MVSYSRKLTFEADEATGVSEGDGLYISADGKVKVMDTTHVATFIGFAGSDAADGEYVSALNGLKTVTAEGAIAVGSKIVPSATTAGAFEVVTACDVSEGTDGTAHLVVGRAITAGVDTETFTAYFD